MSKDPNELAAKAAYEEENWNPTLPHWRAVPMRDSKTPVSDAVETTVPPVSRSELSTVKMVAGNERRYSQVILNGDLEEWVGIGWVTLRAATAADRKQYPTVID